MSDKCINLTQEERELLDRFPTFTAEELEDVNNMFMHYIFYKTVKTSSAFKAGRTLSTSCCFKKEAYYAERPQTTTPEHWAFMSAKHNDRVTCPYCGKTAILKSAGLKKSGIADYQKMMFLHNVEGELFAQAYWVSKDYNRFGLKLRMSFAAAYHFRPGRALMFYTSWDGKYNCETDESRIGKRIKVVDPFCRSGFCGGYVDYKIIHPDAIAKSYLKYCQYFERWQGRSEAAQKEAYSLIRYLAAYTVYPHSVEMLMKTGLKDVVSDLVYRGKKNAAAIKWGEKDPRKAFGLSGDELKQFIGLPAKDIKYVTAYKMLKKKGVKTNMTDLYKLDMSLGSGIEFSNFISTALKYGNTPQKFMNYLERFTGGCHAGGYRNTYEILRHWNDYITAATAIGYDMNQFTVCFPNDLQYAHDNATEEHNRRLRAAQDAEQRKREAERRKKEDERAKKDPAYAAQLEAERQKEANQHIKEELICKSRVKKYTYEHGEYFIRPANSADEIIAEGNALSHCVAGYAARHEKGRLTICFLRKLSEPEKPFITIELTTDGELRQVHGYKNEMSLGKAIAPDPRQKYNFILDPWIEWIAAGSKRDKKGNPIIKNKNKEVTAA